MTTHQLGRINFGPLHHSILGTSLGYDSMFQELERMLNTQPAASDKYPPHNIIKIDDYNYIVELAVAGFSKDEIDISVTDGLLTIKGNKNSHNLDIVYLHKGISNRSFEKTIRIIDTVEVLGASYDAGILSVTLKNVIPESKLPRKIEIGTASLKGSAAKLLVEQQMKIKNQEV